VAKWGTRRTILPKRPNRRKRPINRFQKRRLIFFTIIIIAALLFQSFLYVENQLEPILMSIAKERVNQIATSAVNDAISKKIAQNTNFKDLIQFETDEQGKIRAALFNYSEFARIVGESTARVEDTINELDKIVEPIKLGAAINSELLADYGPTIPVTVVPIGHVEVNPKTTYQNAGINVVVMTVVIEIKATVQVVIPFVQEAAVISSEFPIAQTQIFGEVPQFFYDGGGGSPPIQIVPDAVNIPGSTQPQQPDATPSSTIPIEPLPGFEPFFPVIQGPPAIAN